MRIFILSLLVTVHFCVEQVCDKYDCSDFEGTDKCYSLERLSTYTTYTLKSCPQDKSCDFESNIASGECKKHIPTSLPGEYCTDPGDCRSGNCFEDKCKGFDAEAACNIDEECNYGLYCNRLSRKCTKVKAAGEICTANDRCDVGFVCSDTCIALFSLKTGEATKMSPACETFYSDGEKCAPGARLEGGNSNGPTECTDKCTYRDRSSTLHTRSCTCGFTREQKKYCNPGIGDINLEDYKKYVASLKLHEMQHTYHIKCGVFCITKDPNTLDSTYYKAYITYTKMTNWASVVDNPECVKATVRKAYWNAVSKTESSSSDEGLSVWVYVGIAAGAVIILGVGIGFFIWCRKRRSGTEYQSNDSAGFTTDD
eukprot:TRINITY_DN15285_c0_g2_i6.p2 TRINITY_DN15285_c0_g2~~TRINITY_DN15285_c0_g2_i6.p2  ORF type:complete len:369 (-),score=68.94 TRINITY_DN15285_c0_g2_i6:115-1221(-)